MTRRTSSRSATRSRIQECAPKSKTKRWEVMTAEMIEEDRRAREEHAKVQQVEDAERHAAHEAAGQ